jgi:hypothetical protein
MSKSLLGQTIHELVEGERVGAVELAGVAMLGLAAGVVQSIQKSIDGGDVYSEIRTDLNSVILDKEYKDLIADKGDSLFFVLNQPGAGESVCVGRSRNHCARIMRNGILKGNLPHLQAHLDSATGCQYLVAPNGSLAPRMDSTGKQVCK